MNAVSGAAFAVVRFSVQNASFHARIDVQQQRRGDAGHRHRQQHVDDLAPHGGAVHARRLEDVARDFLEVGEEHPDHDRQVAQAEDDDEPAARVEQAEVL